LVADAGRAGWSTSQHAPARGVRPAETRSPEQGDADTRRSSPGIDGHVLEKPEVLALGEERHGKADDAGLIAGREDGISLVLQQGRDGLRRLLLAALDGCR
jgi:hypothetical protein